MQSWTRGILVAILLRSPLCCLQTFYQAFSIPPPPPKPRGLMNINTDIKPTGVEIKNRKEALWFHSLHWRVLGIHQWAGYFKPWLLSIKHWPAVNCWTVSSISPLTLFLSGGTIQNWWLLNYHVSSAGQIGNKLFCKTKTAIFHGSIWILGHGHH